MIRQAKKEDLPEIGKIYEYAREQMRLSGNASQWGTNRPSMKVVEQDIEAGNLYLICEQGEICGVFAFIIGVDVSYAHIEGGKWLNDEPYGTIHRIASNGRCRGIMKKALSFAEQQIGNIRVDTHEKNTPMRSILEKSGFIYCGIIYVDDGTPRVAYQRNYAAK